jgi:hypothetical protein
MLEGMNMFWEILSWVFTALYLSPIFFLGYITAYLVHVKPWRKWTQGGRNADACSSGGASRGGRNDGSPTFSRQPMVGDGPFTDYDISKDESWRMMKRLSDEHASEASRILESREAIVKGMLALGHSGEEICKVTGMTPAEVISVKCGMEADAILAPLRRKREEEREEDYEEFFNPEEDLRSPYYFCFND